MEEQLKEVIAKIMKIDKGAITDDKRFKEDLGCDSIQQVSILMAMEEKYGKEISNDKLMNIKTVGDAISAIKEIMQMSKNISDINILGIENLEKIIGYNFKDRVLLTKALIHTSYANENDIDKIDTNQRLEFLGDSILELLVSDRLYKILPNADEGLLTRDRASLVCEESLASISRELQLYKFLLLGKGESKEKMKDNNSTLCDTIEAIIGAIYLDGGIDKAKEFIDKYILSDINIKQNVKDADNKDYKTRLQEMMNKVDKKVEYEVVREKGPSHDKTFYVVCKIDGKIESEACGKSKKDAEQEAAKAIIEK